MRRADPSVPDALFRSLADRCRRLVLTHLLDSGNGTATVDELAKVVRDAESNSPNRGPRTIEVTLDHIHLPMLTDEGLIEYDRERGAVSKTPRTEHVEPYVGIVRV